LYVSKLIVRNFKCFGHAEITLNHPLVVDNYGRAVPKRLKNVNLFLGANGSGKSSILKALALGVLAPVMSASGFKANYLVRRQPGQPADDDATWEPYPSDIASVRAELALSDQDTSSKLAPGSSVAGELLVGRTGDVESIESVEPLRNNDGPWRRMFRDYTAAFFLAGYGASRRTERPEGYSETVRGTRYQRVASLFEDHVGLVPFNYGGLRLRRLRVFEQSRTVLNELLRVPGDVELTDRTDSNGQSLFSRSGVLLPFDALSDGYRYFIGWVWDLQCRMAVASRNPWRPSEHGSIRDRLAVMNGVVIVDEIDLLLHPEWQRTVVEQVAQAFPNLQFLFTSHSPLVAGGLEPANIFVLNDETVEQYRENIYGLTPNQVLTSSYFGLGSLRAPNTGTLLDLAEADVRASQGSLDAETKGRARRAPNAKRPGHEITNEPGTDDTVS
jgi:hypothetical protein